MQEKENIAQNKDDIAVGDGRNQYGDKYIIVEMFFISAICRLCYFDLKLRMTLKVKLMLELI